MKELTDQEIRQIELEDWNNRPYRSKKEAIQYYKTMYPYLNDFVIETCIDYEFSLEETIGIDTSKPLSKKNKKVLEQVSKKK